MRQNHWTGACALMIAFGYAGTLHAQEGESSPFADDEAIEADAVRGTELAERRIEFILDQPLQTPLEFPGTPLNTITALIQDEYDIPIVFYTAALDAIAVSPDIEVSINLRNITLRSALALMLRQIEGLTYLVDDEVLLITSEDEADSRLEMRLYRIDDFSDLFEVEPPEDFKGGNWAADDPLIDVITDCVEPISWAENGTGEGTIHPLPPGILVIRQTIRVHREVGRLLSEIRRIRQEIQHDHRQVKAGPDPIPLDEGGRPSDDSQ